MSFLKKNWLLYRKFIHLLSFNPSEIDLFATNFKFEIKLYLIGLSFNRFIFNCDKIFFILCIITNFLFFLTIQSPRILFLGSNSIVLQNILFNVSKKCNQLSYTEKYPLPGAVTNIQQAKIYYFKNSILPFVKNLDCIFSFFSLPNSKILKEAKNFGIPIVGLVELNNSDMNDITYPIICGNTWETIYFFATYFSKILNYKNWFLKIQKFKTIKWSFQTKNKKCYSLYSNNFKFNILKLLYFKLLLLNFNTSFSFFLNRNFFFVNILEFITQVKLFLFKKFYLRKAYLNIFTKKTEYSNYDLRMITGWRKWNILYRSDPNSKRNILKRLEYERKKTWLNNTIDMINGKRDDLFLKISKTKSSAKKNIYLSAIKDFDNRIVNLKYEFQQGTLLERKKPEFNNFITWEDTNSWNYKKLNLFISGPIFKKRKRIKRLSFFWLLKRLFKKKKRATSRRWLYVKKPRKLWLKKKMVIKKMMFYYYNYPLNKKVSKFLKYVKKKKHMITLNSSLNLSNILESKLCIFIIRVRLVSNIYKSKSFITKGNILVNGKTVYNPDYILNLNDIVSLKKSSILVFFKKFLKYKRPRRKRKRKFFSRLKYQNKITRYFRSYKKRRFHWTYKKFKIFRLFRFYWQKKRKFLLYKLQITNVEKYLKYSQFFKSLI